MWRTRVRLWDRQAVVPRAGFSAAKSSMRFRPIDRANQKLRTVTDSGDHLVLAERFELPVPVLILMGSRRCTLGFSMAALIAFQVAGHTGNPGTRHVLFVAQRVGHQDGPRSR